MDISAHRHAAVQQLTDRQLLSDTQPLCGVLDLDLIAAQVANLNAVYPPAGSPKALHTIAAKAAPLGAVLAEVAALGMGCEVASPGELALALDAGFAPEQIVFDSPAKTRAELAQALELGISMNLDNFDELARLDALLDGSAPLAPVGLRINPQIGAGTIDALSTATATSKFGIGLTDPGNRTAIITAYRTRPWLTQLHVHSGSQGIAFEQNARGIAAVVALAKEINDTVGFGQVRTIDIGGGLPVDFTNDDGLPDYQPHRDALEEIVPDLFSGSLDIVTEFGRSLLAKAGFIASSVEYVKYMGGRPIVVQHAGVQVAPRPVLVPTEWSLRVEVYTEAGQLKTGEYAEYDVAGPACFAGDLIARERPLPAVAAGDIVVMPDTGAYYFTLHYSYNALARPAIYACSGVTTDTPNWYVVRPQQSVEEIVAEAGVSELIAI